MDSKTPTPDAKTRARRRLLRGSFSAPAVLTLASGSALADTSATCLAKATATPSTASLVNGTPSDTFLRVRVYRSGSNYFVWGKDFSSIPVSMIGWSPTNHSNQYQSIGVNPSIGQQYNKLYGNVNSNPPGGASASTYWAALRLDADGRIVGIGLSGSGSVVGSSCWTSMNMSTP